MLTYPDQRAVSTRDLAWGTLGENLTDGPMTAEEALTRGGLMGWNTRHVGIQSVMGDHLGNIDDSHILFPEQRGVLADINGKVTPLGVVGTKHNIVQNEETAALLDVIVDEGGAHYNAAGYTRGGRSTFVLMDLPNTLMIGGEDAHGMVMGCMNTHDGSGSLVAFTTLVRHKCTNMLKGSIRGAKSSWRLRHTASIQGRVQEARESLRLTFKWAERFQTEAEKMLATPMSGTEFEAVIDRIIVPTASTQAAALARYAQKRETLRYLFHEADTNTLGRGTRWAAYNAVTEYADWFTPVKGEDRTGAKRAARNLDALTADNDMKQKALSMLLVTA